MATNSIAFLTKVFQQILALILSNFGQNSVVCYVDKILGLDGKSWTEECSGNFKHFGSLILHIRYLLDRLKLQSYRHVEFSIFIYMYFHRSYLRQEIKLTTDFCSFLSTVCLSQPIFGQSSTPVRQPVYRPGVTVKCVSRVTRFWPKVS